MPKRTDAFQRLVFAIERSLHDSRWATVTESKELPERDTGDLREVDIVIEAQIGPRTLVTGIECTAEGRGASKPWVEKIHAKHEHLPIDRTVLVSEHGFSRPAIDRAAHWGMTTMTLEEATTVAWTKYVAAGMFSFRVFMGVTCKGPVTWVPAPGSTRTRPTSPVISRDFEGVRVLDARANDLGSITEVLNQILADPRVVDDVMESSSVGGPSSMSRMWRFPAPYQLRMPDGAKFGVLGLILNVSGRWEISTIRLEPASYGSTNLAHGTGEIFGCKFTAYVTESADGKAHLSVALSPELTKEIGSGPFRLVTEIGGRTTS